MTETATPRTNVEWYDHSREFARGLDDQQLRRRIREEACEVAEWVDTKRFAEHYSVHLAAYMAEYVERERERRAKIADEEAHIQRLLEEGETQFASQDGYLAWRYQLDLASNRLRALKGEPTKAPR